MFQFPGFAFVTLCIQLRIPSSDICKSKMRIAFDAPAPDRILCDPLFSLRPDRQILNLQISKVGFPIRKSSDQSSFAAPQGLSQRTTSFIASQRQGIHQMLLRHLIALMIGVR